MVSVYLCFDGYVWKKMELNELWTCARDVCLMQYPVIQVSRKHVHCMSCLRVCTLSLSLSDVPAAPELISQVSHIFS